MFDTPIPIRGKLGFFNVEQTDRMNCHPNPWNSRIIFGHSLKTFDFSPRRIVLVIVIVIVVRNRVKNACARFPILTLNGK
jgi:hypothetical protein